MPAINSIQSTDQIREKCETEEILVHLITDRVTTMAKRANVDACRLIWGQLVAQCHKASPLDLEALYTASDADFARDLFGMRNYMHRSGNWLTEWRPEHLKGAA